AGVGKQRVRTNRSVTAAVGVGKERIKANGRVHDASGEAKKRIIARRRVTAGIAAIRRWENRLRCGREPKASERQCHEKWQNCCFFGLSQRIHGSSFLSSPAELLSRIAGREEAKNPAGGCPPPDSRSV